MAECIFCNIANKEQEADIVRETEDFVAFQDINPEAPTHLLIIPREHIESINDVTEEHIDLLGRLILTAKQIADTVGVADYGYKLRFHVGRGGGQVVDHLHLHMISDQPMHEE